MKKFGTLFKKELQTILRDRKTFLTFTLMSVVITPALIGGVRLLDEYQKQQLEQEELVIAINNTSQSEELENTLRLNDVVRIIDVENYEKALEDKEIKGYLELSGTRDDLNARYVYDQSSNSSVGSLLKVQTLVQGYAAQQRAEVLNSYSLSEELLNPVTFSTITLQEVQNEPAQSSLILFLLPYIILIGLIQGAAQFAIELTAGEKEKNTLATTLSLNASRITIGLAKIATILLLSLMSLVLNIVSLVLIFVVFPTGLADSGAQQAIPTEINLGPDKLFQIFIVLLPLSFLIASLLVLLGIYARNQKEGGIYILPLVLSAVFIGLTAQTFDANTPLYIFAIPLLGHVAMLKQILLGSFEVLNFIVSIISTFALFALILFVTVNMFKREEVIFRQ